MNIDGWNLVAATVAAILAAAGFAYQVLRDKGAVRPAIHLHVEDTESENELRIVVQSATIGDGTWSLVGLSVRKPANMRLRRWSEDTAEASRGIYPPISVSTAPMGLFGVAGVFNGNAHYPRLRVALDCVLENHMGKRVCVRAIGFRPA
jgi:hypothetical protein